MVSLASDRIFEMRQHSNTITGTYKPMNLPFPEKANGNVYLEFQGKTVNGKPETLGSIVGFYASKSDSLFLIDGVGAKERLLERGPHPEFATELKRVK
jgi:hypothetical protein